MAGGLRRRGLLLDSAARAGRDGCRRRRRRRHGRRQQGRLRSCRSRQQHRLGVAHMGCWGAHKVDHPHRYQAEDKAHQAHAPGHDTGEATGGGQAEQGVANDLLAQHVDFLWLGSGFVRLYCLCVFVGVRGVRFKLSGASLVLGLWRLLGHKQTKGGNPSTTSATSLSWSRVEGGSEVARRRRVEEGCLWRARAEGGGGKDENTTAKQHVSI